MTKGKTVAIYGMGKIGKIAATNLCSASDISIETLHLIIRQREQETLDKWKKRANSLRSEVESGARIIENGILFGGDKQPPKVNIATKLLDLASNDTLPDIIFFNASASVDFSSYKGPPSSERNLLIAKNAPLVADFIAQIKILYHNRTLPFVIVVTNPVNAVGTLIAQSFIEISGDPEDAFKVIGSGSIIDTERSVQILAEMLNIERHPNIERIAAMGQHGEKMVIPEQQVRIDGKTLRDYLKEYHNIENDAADKWIAYWKQKVCSKGGSIFKQIGESPVLGPVAESALLIKVLIKRLTTTDDNSHETDDNNYEDTQQVTLQAYDHGLQVMIGQVGKLTKKGAYATEWQPALNCNEQQLFDEAVNVIKNSANQMRHIAELQTLLAPIKCHVNCDDYGDLALYFQSECRYKDALQEYFKSVGILKFFDENTIICTNINDTHNKCVKKLLQNSK